MNVRFGEDESFVMAMFEKDARVRTMQELHRILPSVQEDEEMLALVDSTLEKMGRLTDQGFSGLDLGTYVQEPVEEV